MATLLEELGIPKAVCDWDYADTSFPPISTPSFIRNMREDDVARHLILKQLPKIEYEWREGLNIPIRYDGKFKHDFWKFINQEYEMKTARLLLDWENSYPHIMINLGGKFWLMASPMNPYNLKVNTNRAFYLAFLFQEKEGMAKDGTRRLAKFIKYLNTMPSCPFEVVYLRVTGQEMLTRGSPHLTALNYKVTNHSTDQLRRLYERVLKIKPTMADDDLGEPYYKSELFSPEDPREWKDKFPWPALLQERSPVN